MRVCVTQNDEDGPHQVLHRLFVFGLHRMLAHALALVPDVDEDACVDQHHDAEGQQVEHSPEHQVAAAVHGRHLGAVPEVAQAVPAHAGNQAHDYGDCPDAHNQQYHPHVGHLTVELHGEDGLMPLQSNGHQVNDRGSQTGIDQTLQDEVNMEQLGFHLGQSVSSEFYMV